MLTSRHPSDIEFDRRRIVWLLWVYLALLIGEGALRKWVLPGWSDALLVVRDPLAVVILVLAFRGGFFTFRGPARGFAALTVLFTGLAFFQLAAGTIVSIPVLLFG